MTRAAGERDRLGAVDGPASADTIGYRYDVDGKRTRLPYPNGQAVSYDYDTAARLTTLTDWASRVTAYQYVLDGRPKQATHVNGLVTTYAYDNPAASGSSTPRPPPAR